MTDPDMILFLCVTLGLLLFAAAILYLSVEIVAALSKRFPVMATVVAVTLICNAIPVLIRGAVMS